MTPRLTFARDGAERFAAAAIALLPEIRILAAGLVQERAGIRLHGTPGLPSLLACSSPIGAIAAQAIGDRVGRVPRPVRAILFDKTARANWSLGWHQDRTIVVAKRCEAPGFGPWTMKAGLHHVAPPFDLLSRMVTLRIHLDPVTDANAPLLVAPGSHRFGLVAEAEIDSVVARCGIAVCHADAGDVWLYATPILHASQAAHLPSRRRVLQVDYAADPLPSGLEWLGV